MTKEEIEEHNRMNSLIDAFKNPYIRINGEKENYYFCPLCHHCYNKYYFNNGGHLKYQHGLEKEEIIKQWRCFLIRYPQKWYEYAKKKTEDLPIIRKETNKQPNSNSKAIVNIVDIPGEYRVYSDDRIDHELTKMFKKEYGTYLNFVLNQSTIAVEE